MADQSGHYWGKVLAKRLTRRRALALKGGGTAAAFLAACGGGDSEDEQGPKDASGLLTQLKDELARSDEGAAETGLNAELGWVRD